MMCCHSPFWRSITLCPWVDDQGVEGRDVVVVGRDEKGWQPSSGDGLVGGYADDRRRASQGSGEGQATGLQRQREAKGGIEDSAAAGGEKNGRRMGGVGVGVEVGKRDRLEVDRKSVV